MARAKDTLPVRAMKIRFLLTEILSNSNTKDVANGHYLAAGIEVSLQQPKSRDIVKRFHEIFDTGVEDPLLFNTVDRIRKLLTLMVKADVAGKYITGIYKDRPDDHGTWCHSYRLNDAMLNDIKYGNLTLDQAAVHIDKRIKEQSMKARPLFRTPVTENPEV